MYFTQARLPKVSNFLNCTSIYPLKLACARPWKPSTFLSCFQAYEYPLQWFLIQVIRIHIWKITMYIFKIVIETRGPMVLWNAHLIFGPSTKIKFGSKWPNHFWEKQVLIFKCKWPWAKVKKWPWPSICTYLHYLNWFQVTGCKSSEKSTVFTFSFR